jgi:hypothetical protein
MLSNTKSKKNNRELNIADKRDLFMSGLNKLAQKTKLSPNGTVRGDSTGSRSSDSENV